MLCITFSPLLEQMVFGQKLILKKYISLGNGHIIKMHCSYYCEEYKFLCALIIELQHILE